MFENYTLSQIRDEIINFKNDPDFQELQNFYYSKSYSEILGVSRRELSHSGFLGWFLGNSESHNLGDFTIKKFLDIILKFSNNILKNEHGELLDIFATENYSVEKLVIKPEYKISGVGRIDLFIELTILVNDHPRSIRIIIENKVESSENNDQTNSYYNYFNSLKIDDQVDIFIYLSPMSTLELIELIEPECNCKKFIQINYQSLVDYMIEPALKQNISLRTQNILSEYLKSLSQPSINEDSDTHKQELIMALGNDERKLLSNFWKKNQKLILASLYAISSDPEQEKDNRDIISQALDSLTSERDRSTYNISYNSEVFSGNLQKSDIGYQVVKLLNEKNLINVDTISFLKDDRSAGLFLIKKKFEVTDTEIRYRKYRINNPPELIFNGDEYYVVRNWGRDNIPRLIEKFVTKFPGLTITKN